jgi:hypothetical protein
MRKHSPSGVSMVNAPGLVLLGGASKAFAMKTGMLTNCCPPCVRLRTQRLRQCQDVIHTGDGDGEGRMSVPTTLSMAKRTNSSAESPCCAKRRIALNKNAPLPHVGSYKLCGRR